MLGAEDNRSRGRLRWAWHFRIQRREEAPPWGEASVRVLDPSVSAADQWRGYSIGGRSIQAFVRKYGAYHAYQTRDGWFTLTIAL